ncbi:uncharacterized protein LOC143528074 isoform X2 [Brachyhypopomus gauderio]
MLPDSDLLRGQRGQDSKLKKSSVPSSDRALAPRAFRSPRSSLFSSKAETLLSDRQLRPRPCRRPQTTTVQRSDGEEEEELSEIRRPFVRTFRIESDPALCSDDEQQDEIVSVSLADLVRHMHPYSLRVDLEEEEEKKKMKDKSGRELQEEDVFVDVEGDDEVVEGLLGVPGLIPLVAPEMGLDVESSVQKPQEKTQKMWFSVGGEHNKGDCDDAKKLHRSILAKKSNTGGVKKKVWFAPDISSVHEYQPDDEACECAPTDGVLSELHEGDVTVSSSGPTGSSESLIDRSETVPSQHGNKKPRSISLQEYRLLKRKALPEEERKWDHRTKWPSVPEIPGELPPIPSIPGYNPPVVHVKSSPAKAKLSDPGYSLRPNRTTPLRLKLPSKQKTSGLTFMHAVDPPNPVTVPLLSTPPVRSDSSPLSEKHVLPQHTGMSMCHRTQSRCVSPRPERLGSPDQLVQEPQSEAPREAPLDAEAIAEECSPTITAVGKANIAAPSPPARAMPAVVSQRRPPPVQIPTAAGDRQREEEPRKESSNEMGIQATDVTSLLEQFETQGFTPPATPPHHIWNPLGPGQRAKPHKACKPSPCKAIQIIEPRPMPPSKVHFKPQPTSSIPAASLSLAFLDHDYCGSRELTLGNKRTCPGIYVHEKPPNQPRNRLSHRSQDHRMLREAEHLSGSVLLSPESSPCRLEDRGAGRPEDAEVLTGKPSRHSSCSPSSLARGRTRRRVYRRKYHHSDSSSVSSSRSPSSSSSSASSSSRSPPRKRLRPSRSSSSSSSCSSSSSMSRSMSPSGSFRVRRRSPSGSVSPHRSPQPDRNQKWIRQRRHREHVPQSRWEEERRMRKQKAIEERRVVYVGRIRGTMTQAELRDRFALFGKIEDCTVHFRNHGDHYGFITYYNTGDAFAAIENGAGLRQPDELPFDICFGGRRQFCQSSYADLDSNREVDPAPLKSRCGDLDFDTLLKQAQRGVKR